MSEVFLLQPRPAELDAERARVLAAVRAVLPGDAEVFEVGSTAVPGVIGKQDLDLLVRAPASAFEQTRQALDRVFTRDLDQLSNDAYQGYRVASPVDVAIQCTIKGSQYDTFLDFIAALQRSPARVEAYNALKQRWHGHDMRGYREAKARFIAETLGEQG